MSADKMLGSAYVDRLTAVEQSIYMEVELSQLFNTLALALYQQAPIMEFWQRMSRSEADQALALEFEKWRIVREDLDHARIIYDDPALLKAFQRFDKLRSAVVHPLEVKQSLELGLKAENMVLDFQADRILIADFGISDHVLTVIVETEERHREALERLLAASDPTAELEKIELAGLDTIIEA